MMIEVIVLGDFSHFSMYKKEEHDHSDRGNQDVKTGQLCWAVSHITKTQTLLWLRPILQSGLFGTR